MAVLFWIFFWSDLSKIDQTWSNWISLCNRGDTILHHGGLHTDLNQCNRGSLANMISSHWPLQPQWSQQPLQSYFFKKLPDPDGSIIPGTKMTNMNPFLWNGSWKIHFLLISEALSVRGCWGQSMLLFWKLIHKTQMSNPPEATSYCNSTKILIVLPLRTIYFYSLNYETHRV